MKMTEFTDLLHYMHITINAGKKECTPCQMEYEDMDIDGDEEMLGCPSCNYQN